MSDQAPGDLRPDLKALTRPELARWLDATLGAPRFRADQLFRWLHKAGVRSLDAMTNLPRALRDELAARAVLGGLRLDAVQRSEADGTRKLLLTTADGLRLESVIIPMEGARHTLCVSSQIGCKVGCRFCLTGTMTARRDLAASEIVDQLLWAQTTLEGSERVARLVYMGMGEPLDNLDAVVASLHILMDEHGQALSGRRITVSTSGVLPRIEPLLAAAPVNLALSLNASSDAQRQALIPLARRWDLDALWGVLEGLELAPRRDLTLEYVLLADVNDSPADARRLVARVKRLPARLGTKVNLIPFNPWPGAPYGRPEPSAVDAFGRILRDARVTVTVRESRGADIGAACGQLDGEPAG